MLRRKQRDPKSLGSTATASDSDVSEAAKAAASGAVSPGAAAGALEVKREPQVD